MPHGIAAWAPLPLAVVLLLLMQQTATTIRARARASSTGLHVGVDASPATFGPTSRLLIEKDVGPACQSAPATATGHAPSSTQSGTPLRMLLLAIQRSQDNKGRNSTQQQQQQQAAPSDQRQVSPTIAAWRSALAELVTQQPDASGFVWLANGSMLLLRFVEQSGMPVALLPPSNAALARHLRMRAGPAASDQQASADNASDSKQGSGRVAGPAGASFNNTSHSDWQQLAEAAAKTPSATMTMLLRHGASLIAAPLLPVLGSACDCMHSRAWGWGGD